MLSTGCAMSAPRSEKDKSPEDQISRYTIRRYDDPAVPDSLLDEKSGNVHPRSPGPRARHRRDSGRLPDGGRYLPTPPRQDAHLGLESAFCGQRLRPVGEFYPLVYRPPFIDTDRGKQEFLSSGVSSSAARSRVSTPLARFKSERVLFAGSVPRTAAAIRPSARSAIHPLFRFW